MESNIQHSGQLDEPAAEAVNTKMPAALSNETTEGKTKRKVRSHTLGYLQAAMKSMVPRCGSIEVWKQSTDENNKALFRAKFDGVPMTISTLCFNLEDTLTIDFEYMWGRDVPECKRWQDIVRTVFVQLSLMVYYMYTPPLLSTGSKPPRKNQRMLFIYYEALKDTEGFNQLEDNAIKGVSYRPARAGEGMRWSRPKVESSRNTVR